MNSRRTIALIGVTLLLVAGCKPKPKKPIKDKDNDTAVSCEIRADYPHRSSTDRNFVDGKATIICKGGAADKVTVTAVLELSRNGGAFKALPPVAGWKTVMSETSVKAGSPTTAVAAYTCKDVQPGDKFRTTYRSESVTYKGKPLKLSVKGSNPNPSNGVEVSCR